MKLEIPEDIAAAAKLSEKDALIELACRLFDADRLDKATAGRLAGLSRPEFESALKSRGMSIIHIDDEYVRDELNAIEKTRKHRPGEAA